MTELATVLPTAAVQSMSGMKRSEAENAGRKPFQLGGCHAWRLRWRGDERALSPMVCGGTNTDLNLGPGA
jgi:hypothetical protein